MLVLPKPVTSRTCARRKIRIGPVYGAGTMGDTFSDWILAATGASGQSKPAGAALPPNGVSGPAAPSGAREDAWDGVRDLRGVSAALPSARPCATPEGGVRSGAHSGHRPHCPSRPRGHD